MNEVVISYRWKRGVTMATIKPQFTLRLDLKVHIKLKKIAEKENRSMTNMIEYLSKKEIERYEAEHGEIKITEEDVGLE